MIGNFEMKNIISEFKKLGDNVSYCYASDNVDDWKMADDYKKTCINLYVDFPQFQDEMKEIAKTFLWRLDFENIR
jgi:hypothetical protein